MRKTRKGIALLLLVAILFGMNITGVLAADYAVISEPKVYNEGTNILNLEGDFSANGSDGAIWVKEGAQLTINGTDATEVHGELGADKYSMAVWAKGEKTKVVINGGYYTNETDGSKRGTDLIYASEKAVIEINGGTFKAAKEEWTLNGKDDTGSQIIVKGGTFYKFDPSNNTVGAGEVIVPEGYEVVKNGDWYSVYTASKVYTKGTNTLDLKGTFTANGSNGAIWVKEGAQLTINGTDKTEVHGALGADNYSMAVWAKGEDTKVVINGGYYTNETDGSKRGTDLIYASEKAVIEINGGTFKAAKEEWTLNGKDDTGAQIVVKGGTFYKFDPSNNTVGEGEVVVPEGYRVVKNGDWYTVYKEHTITVKEAEGGKIIVREVPTSDAVKEIDKAISGETVEVVVEPVEGYKFKGISGVDGLKDVAEYAYQFVMPNKDVVLTPIFEKYTTETEVPSEVANKKEVEGMLIETLEELAKDPDVAAKLEGKDIEIEVKVNSADKTITDSEKSDIEKEVAKKVEDLKVASYLDITIVVKDAKTDVELTTIPEVKETITFTVAVPEGLPEVAEGYTRVFYIIRNHKGDIDVWEAEEVEGKLSFESDKFSTYAIAYKDVKDETTTPPAGDEGATGEGEVGVKPEDKPTTGVVDPEVKPETPDVPKTGDNVVTYVVLAVIAMVGTGVTIKMRRK